VAVLLLQLDLLQERMEGRVLSRLCRFKIVLQLLPHRGRVHHRWLGWRPWV
jgi:hypothetical protein